LRVAAKPQYLSRWLRCAQQNVEGAHPLYHAAHAAQFAKDDFGPEIIVSARSLQVQLSWVTILCPAMTNYQPKKFTRRSPLYCISSSGTRYSSSDVVFLSSDGPPLYDLRG
jgi:hypothetical protein